MKKKDELVKLRELSTTGLGEELMNLRKAQFTLRLKRANGLLDNPHHITLTRKSVARLKTIMAEKVGKSHDE